MNAALALPPHVDTSGSAWPSGSPARCSSWSDCWGWNPTCAAEKTTTAGKISAQFNSLRENSKTESSTKYPTSIIEFGEAGVFCCGVWSTTHALMLRLSLSMSNVVCPRAWALTLVMGEGGKRLPRIWYLKKACLMSYNLISARVSA